MKQRPLSTVHPDWWRPYPDNLPNDWRSRAGVDVSEDDGVLVSWEEDADDHSGTRTRSVHIPRAVLLAVLGVSGD